MSDLFSRVTGTAFALMLALSLGAVDARAQVEPDEDESAEAVDGVGCPSGQSLVEIWCVTHQKHHLRCM